ncbi:PREDICTED: uncharacterized protein LOC109206397 [Nicotiana attenuata]|uniref:uncharacterized protein LOC109206397 n=1 Tax=Nicotiana attenuata TaxID=49451 RepID=UPI000905693B|nr:PREDICTED: uncharacterized protein LOC109206397 [Nicotiana attenuata]
MKDLGELKFFLGIEFALSEKGIYMSQHKYALELNSELGLAGTKPSSTPLEVNQKLTSVDFDKLTSSYANIQDPLLKDAGEYQRLVGRLLYLTMTRPDISFAVQTLSQHMHSPKQSHLDAAMRVVKYIKDAPGQGLLLPSSGDGTLKAYCDANWGACLQTRRSVTGYCVFFGNALISWKSKKQDTVARSSAEAEFRSMASTAAEIVWLIGLLGELDVKVQLPVALYCDSKAAIQIAANPIFHERMKHIDIGHFIREKIKAGIIKTTHVNTKEQIADILTKGLGRTQHQYLLCKLGVKNIFLLSSLRGSIEPG